MIEPGRAADFVLVGRAQHSSGIDLPDSVQTGDLPGAGMVVVNGMVSCGRSQHTPLAERVPEIGDDTSGPVRQSVDRKRTYDSSLRCQ